MLNVEQYRELVHRMFDGAVTPAVVRARGLPPFTTRKRQGRLKFEAGAPKPHDGAEALTAARDKGERQP